MIANGVNLLARCMQVPGGSCLGPLFDQFFFLPLVDTEDALFRVSIECVKE